MTHWYDMTHDPLDPDKRALEDHIRRVQFQREWNLENGFPSEYGISDIGSENPSYNWGMPNDYDWDSDVSYETEDYSYDDTFNSQFQEDCSYENEWSEQDRYGSNFEFNVFGKTISIDFSIG